MFFYAKKEKKVFAWAEKRSRSVKTGSVEVTGTTGIFLLGLTCATSHEKKIALSSFNA